MRDILERLRAWWDAQVPFALATVVDVRRSAPRPVGAAMAVSIEGEVAGSVSGGCVEAAVHETARQVLETGAAVLERYGISDDDALGVGLPCGGEITLLVEPVDRASVAFFGEVAASVAAGEPVALVTVLDGVDLGQAPAAGSGAKLAVWEDHVAGGLVSAELDGAITAAARAMLAHGDTGRCRVAVPGEGRAVGVFVTSFVPPARMLIFGATTVAGALARLGAFLGDHVTICDARPAFATPQRFPEAHEVVVEWPHRFLQRTAVDARTAVCVLTHDPKFDLPLLEVALRSGAGYVGAMGSRRTHEERLVRLRGQGLSDEELARLRSPIGLDLGGRTPEETAVSIVAEVIHARHHGAAPSAEKGPRQVPAPTAAVPLSMP